ncbi:Flp pilus assembly protein CpaB [Rhodopirellula sp. MGV]|uniref:Flp pilus assembly protein CpaB n=1 Tax=Rhodopirellula sp. MGV TaxID=2023130 RepID=UPI000B95DCBA|nr:Flp pilus assembly protein CpaB [Rhodopirellula sp. MGV]OYP37701.1 Flp pilus assembly protein CpaB [Rhodopirellula sp. MGV]PNY37139.1 Flp pilus assembly protein CpaB [Rhodopirellula baltica]
MKATAPRKANSGTILIGVFAVTIGLAGTYVMRIALQKDPPVVVVEQPEPEPEPPPKPVRVTVPLASRDIKAGTEITLDDVAIYRLTKEEIKESVGESSFMTNPKQIIGKVLQVDMKRSESFSTTKLLPAGKYPGVAGRLKPGLRAVTIQMSPDNALLGFASPGQSVDVLFHYGQEDGMTGSGGKSGRGFQPAHHVFNPPGLRDYRGNRIGGSGGFEDSEFQSATATLIQGAEILAIGMASTPTDWASPLATDETVRVTLAVAPKQAEMIRVADGHGELSLTLRGPEDNQLVSLVDPVTLDHIIDFDNTVHEMEIYRGTSLSKVHFGSNRSIKERVFSSPNEPTSGMVGNPAMNPSMVPTMVPAPGYYGMPYAVSPYGGFVASPAAADPAETEAVK